MRKMKVGLVAMVFLVSVVDLPTFGQNQFVKTLGGIDFDHGYSVVEVSNGGFVLTGYTYSYGVGESDLLLAKFDSLGNHLWTRILGGTGYDIGYSVVEVSDGGIVLAGYTQSYGAGGYDFLLTKFDGSGNHLWTRTLGGANWDYGLSVVEVSDGGLILTGYTESYGAGGWDLLLAKFDGSGNTCLGEFVTPEIYTAHPSIEVVHPMVASPEPDTATWHPTVTSPTPTITVVCKEGVEHEDLLSLPNEFFLSQNYPNPFNPITQIKYGLAENCNVKLEIYNILGQKVATLVDGTQKAGYKIARWDASSFASGIYFYRLQAGDFVQTRKMVLIR